MISISLCMIVKNEEEVLERCLSCVKEIADEIIIVDTGSADRTKEIAHQFTDKVYDFNWENDFSKARNFSFSKATKDYQLWLDADDIILDSEIDKILALKKVLNKNIDMVTMQYDTHFDSEGLPVLTSTRERLLRREKNYKWQDPVHECIPLNGNIFHSDIVITHRKSDKTSVADEKRNLKIYEELERKDHEFSPRQMYYFARELKDNGRYKKAAMYFTRFLDSKRGWIEDIIASCLALSDCYKKLGEKEKILPALTESFLYDSPRADICSEIGYYYMSLKNYKLAADWFLIALSVSDKEFRGFVLKDYLGFIPCIELCVCYYEMGEMERAKYYNSLAEKYKPDSETVKSNKEFFKEAEN